MQPRIKRLLRISFICYLIAAGCICLPYLLQPEDSPVWRLLYYGFLVFGLTGAGILVYATVCVRRERNRNDS